MFYWGFLAGDRRRDVRHAVPGVVLARRQPRPGSGTGRLDVPSVIVLDFATALCDRQRPHSHPRCACVRAALAQRLLLRRDCRARDRPRLAARCAQPAAVLGAHDPARAADARGAAPDRRGPALAAPVARAAARALAAALARARQGPARRAAASGGSARSAARSQLRAVLRCCSPGTCRRCSTQRFARTRCTRSSTRLFFCTALLFWKQVITSPPLRARLGAAQRILYVIGAMVVSWALAVVLALAPSPLYAPYAHEAQPTGRASRRSPTSRSRPG